MIWRFSRLARASFSGAERSKLPTWSARNGGIGPSTIFLSFYVLQPWALYRAWRRGQRCSGHGVASGLGARGPMPSRAKELRSTFSGDRCGDLL